MYESAKKGASARRGSEEIASGLLAPLLCTLALKFLLHKGVHHGKRRRGSAVRSTRLGQGQSQSGIAGAVKGNTAQQVKGKVQKAVGKVQEAMGKAGNAADHAWQEEQRGLICDFQFAISRLRCVFPNRRLQI